MTVAQTAAETATPSDKLVGGTLVGGAYELLEPLDQGALGVVYVAKQAHLGRKVAIKLIREPYAGSPQFTGSLLREARAGCLIEHPNVARTYDFGYDGSGRCFMVMELLTGQPLVKIIERVPRPPIEWTISIVSQVLAGIGAAHDRGVIHRDIKPENIVIQTTLGDDGVPIDLAKLCDFGIASVPCSDILGEDGRPLTFEGRMCGTPNYMSPEQAQGLALDVPTDIYSCGVLLYELATGRLPFYDSSLMGLAEKHVSEQPPRPRDICPDIDPALEQIILRALEKNPERRYPTARAMRADLLALDAAKRTTSLLEDWADKAGAPRFDGWRFENTMLDHTTQLERRLKRIRFAAAAAVACCAMALCASLAWRHLSDLQRWWGAQLLEEPRVSSVEVTSDVGGSVRTEGDARASGPAVVTADMAHAASVGGGALGIAALDPAAVSGQRTRLRPRRAHLHRRRRRALAHRDRGLLRDRGVRCAAPAVRA
jgi:serine/threonine protein kinase